MHNKHIVTQEDIDNGKFLGVEVGQEIEVDEKGNEVVHIDTTTEETLEGNGKPEDESLEEMSQDEANEGNA